MCRPIASRISNMLKWLIARGDVELAGLRKRNHHHAICKAKIRTRAQVRGIERQAPCYMLPIGQHGIRSRRNPDVTGRLTPM